MQSPMRASDVGKGPVSLEEGLPFLLRELPCKEENIRFPPLSVPLNFIPTTPNPQYPTSPAPLGLLQKTDCSPFASDLSRSRNQSFPKCQESGLDLTVPHPRRAGRAHSHSLPALPACLSHPGRASLRQPSPVSSASPPLSSPSGPDRIEPEHGTRAAPGGPRTRARGRDRSSAAVGGSQDFL